MLKKFSRAFVFKIFRRNSFKNFYLGNSPWFLLNCFRKFFYELLQGFLIEFLQVFIRRLLLKMQFQLTFFTDSCINSSIGSSRTFSRDLCRIYAEVLLEIPSMILAEIPLGITSRMQKFVKELFQKLLLEFFQQFHQIFFLISLMIASGSPIAIVSGISAGFF